MSYCTVIIAIESASVMQGIYILISIKMEIKELVAIIMRHRWLRQFAISNFLCGK